MSRVRAHAHAGSAFAMHRAKQIGANDHIFAIPYAFALGNKYS
jgi:hypothetical protein